MNPARTIRTLLWAGSAAGLLAAGWLLVIASPHAALMSLVGDDAGYYFNIARNLCLGHGCTFDRLHTTGGFNPLFLGLLTGLYALLPGPREVLSLFRVGLLLDYGLTVGSFFVYVALMRRFVATLPDAPARSTLVPAAALLYSLFVCWKGLYGMDAHLTLLLLFLYGLGVVRGGLLKERLPLALLDGALLGLLVLARADSLFLVAPVYLLIVLLVDRRTRARNAALQAAVTVALVVPYLAWNRGQSQHWMAISARIKTGFPRLDVGSSLDAVLHSSLHRADLLFMGAVLVAGCVALVLLGRRISRDGRQVLSSPVNGLVAAWAGYAVLRVAWMVLFSRYDVQAGYLIAASPIAVLILLWLFARIPAGRIRPQSLHGATAAVLVLLSLLLFAGKLHAVTGRWHDWTQTGSSDQRTMALSIQQTTPPDAVLFGGGLGLMGFFSDRAWINADGVANDDAYQSIFSEEGGLARYLEDNGVTHVVFSDMETRDEGPDGFRVVVPGHLSGEEQTYRVAPDDLLQQRRLADRGNHRVYLARYTP